ncbi:MAG TPA: MBL fold metallo-hydrolase [Salinimicrobium sp.]|nr:MBL fold metallo-hydrolase [Salinimicrobium sp.]
MKQFITLFTACLFLFGCKSNSEAEDTVVLDPNEEALLEVDAGDTSSIEIIPISHATAVISWDGSTIYLDPTGGASAFYGMERPDFVLVTDIHGDHLDPQTLKELKLKGIPIIAPQAVKDQLKDSLAQNITVLNNGETIDQSGFSVEAIPMYNLREEAKQFHTRGRGNGYVLQRNGKRLYIAGDTGDIPEMRQLKDIDLALIPMNLPYTMPVERAADAVLEFEPKIVYPYHFRGSEGFADVEKFKSLVRAGNPDTEVIIANWYPERNQEN